MAINYATKYSSKVVEEFKLESLTDAAAGHGFSFAGAKTIVVSTINTVPLTDFNRNGEGNRFGVPTNLGDTIQEMTMRKDQGFALSIDAGDSSDQAIEKSAGAVLRNQIDIEVIPTIDVYRLEKWAEGAGTVKMSGSSATLTKSTILGAIISLGSEMSNAKVPRKNRTLYVPNKNYQLLKQADAVVNLERAGNSAVVNGSVGTIDGNHVIPIPDGMFPEGVEFLIKYKDCTVDPVKLQNYHIRKDAQGYDGPVVEGRIYYDAFVIDTKKAGVGVYKIGT